MRIAILPMLLVACGSHGSPPPAPPSSGPSAATSATAAATATATATATAASPGLPPLGGVVHWRPLPADRPFLVERMSTDDELRCAVSKAGEVACWGRIQPGGDGPADQRLGAGAPLLLDGVRDALAVGTFWFYICVAQRTGSGGCFQLHDVKRKTPQFPEPPVEFAPVGYRLCARLRGGGVGCIDTDGRYTPIGGVANATGLACAGDTCCALTPGGARCFGRALDKLGIAESVQAGPPTVAPPPAAELALAHAGACVRKPDGGAHCWGEAAKLSRTSGVRRVVAVADDVCLILDDGALRCADERTPVAADAADTADRCIVHRDGAVSCHGGNSYGELGDGHPLLSTLPVRVGAFSDIVDLRVAHTTSCALRKGGTLWCWGGGPLAETSGYAPKGELAWGQYVAGCRIEPPNRLHCFVPSLGGSWSTETFETKGGPSPIKTAAIDRDSSVCVVDGGGKIACRFGMADNGVDPRWIPLAAPAPVAALHPISTGFCARLVDGRVSCFVDDRYEDDPDFLETLPKAKLQLVPGVSGAVQLATGQDDACALTAKAEVWCWNAARPKPAELPSLRGATWIAGNHLHHCAVLRGEVWCWGDNYSGQIGDGTPGGRIEPVKTPVRAKTPFTAVRVGVGRDSTCALDDQGRVWCWGADRYGELGQGRPLRADQPVPVVGLGPKQPR
jgi:hypothetical protein